MKILIKQLKNKKARDESGLFVVEGEKFVNEIPFDWDILQYIVSETFSKNHDSTTWRARAAYEIVKDSIFESMSATVSPQGILAVCRQRHYILEDVLAQNDAKCAHSFYLLGESLNDPGNIGTLIRTAAAAGASGIILTTNSGDIYNPKVLRASAGAALRIPIVTHVETSYAFDMLKNAGIPIFAAHPRGEATPYDLDLCSAFCLLVGNETHGISDASAKAATTLVTLPMAGEIESLNASAAGSILLYEAVRQRLIR